MPEPALQQNKTSQSQSQSSGIISREQLGRYIERLGMNVADVIFPKLSEEILALRAGRNILGAASAMSHVASSVAGHFTTETTSPTERLETSDIVSRPNKVTVI